MFPSDCFTLCTIFATVPTEKISSGRGSSTLASCCVARKIFLSPARASSRARTLDSRPTTNGVIMCGKMTTSRMGIMGKRRVSVFSLELSICERKGPAAGPGPPRCRSLAGFLQKRHVDLLGHHHFLGDQELADLFIGWEVVHQ